MSGALAMASQLLKSVQWQTRRLPERTVDLFRRIGWRKDYWSTLLQAKVRRMQLSRVTFVGITGSAGKTATKDLAAAVLGALGPCQSSLRTSNGHMGMAETILGTHRQHRFTVVELSASRPGYLDRPIRFVRPQIGVLTLVARDHYSAFKSVEAIAEEKGKLIAALPRNGVAVINRDNAYTREIGERCTCRVIWIGEEQGADLRLLAARSTYPEPLVLSVEYQGRQYEVRTALHGKQLALSVLAALGVGLAAGVPLDQAIAALAQARITEARMQIMESGDGVTFVRDDWKAPLWSFQAPLDFLHEAKAKRKVAIIGTLSDYSLSASKLYPKVARQVREAADLVVFVGPHALRALKARSDADDQSILGFPDIRAAAAHLRTALQPGDLVLVKGSHKADHLTRLILDRIEPVLCWDERCRRGMLCERCPRVRDPALAVPEERVPANVASSSVRVGEPTFLPVVVGLGNPGVKYERTPHNVGRLAVEALARDAGGQWAEEPEGRVCTIEVEGITVKLFEPVVAMNRCGPPVRTFLDRIGSDAGHCILIHDDMDLAIGEVRTKRDGGDAGHRGVRSILASLDTGSLLRVRMGVRRPGDERKARQIVLEDFSAEESAALPPVLEKAVAQLRASIVELQARCEQARWAVRDAASDSHEEAEA